MEDYKAHSINSIRGSPKKKRKRKRIQEEEFVTAKVRKEHHSSSLNNDREEIYEEDTDKDEDDDIEVSEENLIHLTDQNDSEENGEETLNTDDELPDIDDDIEVCEANLIDLTGQNDSEENEVAENGEETLNRDDELSDIELEELEALSLSLSSEYNKFYTAMKKTQKEEIELLKFSLELVHPDKYPYGKGMRYLNYDLIAKNVNCNPQESKKKLKHLIRNTVKTKCLRQILEESYECHLVEKRKCTPFSLFFGRNKNEIDKTMEEGEFQSKMCAAANLWKNLSAKEKASYTLQQEETKKKGNGETPFKLFYEKKKIKRPKLSSKDAKEAWQELDARKKMKFISKSLSLRRDLVEMYEMKRFAVEKPNIKEPNKEDALLYLQYMGMPELPIKLPALLYFKTKYASRCKPKQSTLFAAIDTFKELSIEEKDFWITEYNNKLHEYQGDLDEWKSKQDENTLYLLNKYMPIKPPIRRNKLKTLHKNLVMVPIPGGPRPYPKFANEPDIPPLSAYQLFTRDLPPRDPSRRNGNLMAHFRTLDKKVKYKISVESQMIKDAYIKKLKDFVDSLPIEGRNTFLGYRRTKYIKILRTDIFEEDYPNKVYPIYDQSEFNGKARRKRKESRDKMNATKKMENLKEELEHDGQYEEDPELDETMNTLESPLKESNKRHVEEEMDVVDYADIKKELELEDEGDCTWDEKYLEKDSELQVTMNPPKSPLKVSNTKHGQVSPIFGRSGFKLQKPDKSTIQKKKKKKKKVQSETNMVLMQSESDTSKDSNVDTWFKSIKKNKTVTNDDWFE